MSSLSISRVLLPRSGNQMLNKMEKSQGSCEWICTEGHAMIRMQMQIFLLILFYETLQNSSGKENKRINQMQVLMDLSKQKC